MRTRKSMVAAVGAVFLAAACSSGNSGPGPTQFVEKSFAVAQADAICQQLNADVPQLISAFRTAHANVTDAEARDFLVNTLFPRIDRAVGDIHRIGEPTKDRVGFDQAVMNLDKDLSALKLAASDPVKVVTNKIVIYDKSASLFADYGFKECGKVA